MEREYFKFRRELFEAIEQFGEKAQLKLYQSILKLVFNQCGSDAELEQLCTDIESGLEQNRHAFGLFLTQKRSILRSNQGFQNATKSLENKAESANKNSGIGEFASRAIIYNKEEIVDNKEEIIEEKEIYKEKDFSVLDNSSLEFSSSEQTQEIALGASEQNQKVVPGKKSGAKSSAQLKKSFSEFVSMSQSEYDKLVLEHGADFTERCVEVLNNFKGSSGKKYKSDYFAILSWVADKVQKEQQNRASPVGTFQQNSAYQSKHYRETYSSEFNTQEVDYAAEIRKLEQQFGITAKPC